MSNEQEQHMLLELEQRLENGPYHINVTEIEEIGARAEPPLTEHQTYRIVNRLYRQGKITGEPITVEEHPAGWAGFWVEDVQI